MRILVTGSSGTIGTRLCEALLERGHDVRGVDWLPNKWQPAINARTQILDLRKSEQAKTMSADVDIIVHLAANARVYELVEHPDRAMDNMQSTFNVLEFARTNSIKRCIFASSRESYGNSACEKYTEDMVRIEHCESPYTASKLAGEALVEAYRRCYGIDQITFRFSNVYGMYDDSVRVVPLFIKLAKNSEPLMIFGEKKCLDFTYIDDTVAGIILGIEKFEHAKNTTYNLAFGSGTTIIELAHTIKKLTNSTSTISIGEPRTGEVIRYIADISKAKHVLGYDPKTDFASGIQKAVDWYLKYT